MNKLRYAFAMVSILTLVAAGQERGMRPVEMEDEKGERFIAYENSFALVIGINRYADPNIRMLNYAVQDADDIAELLVGLEFPRENITVLKNEEATLQRVKEEFAAMGARTKKNDRLLVYWAGHGETESLPRGGELGYLIPSDGKRDQMYSTCLSMDEVKRLAERVAAKHVLFLVDACYGGLSAVTSRSLSKETERYLQKITGAEAIQIITAGTRDEQVVESSSWTHSAFAKALLDGFQSRIVDIDGNGVVTADELYTYLQPKVFELSRSEHPRGHTPVMARLKPSEGQFTFVVSIPQFSLKLMGLPARNTLYINGKKVAEDQTVVTQALRRASYTIEIEAPGRERYSQMVNLSEDRELVIQMASLMVFYILETNPSGAKAKIDGLDAGQTPLRKELAIGQHRIELTKDEYEPLEYIINLSDQNNYEKKDMKFNLYDVTVISNPRGAQIYLNEIPQEGTTPATLRVRPGSKYTVEVQHEGQKLATTFQPAGSGAVTADFRSKQIQFSGPTLEPSTTAGTQTQKKEEKPEPAAPLTEKEKPAQPPVLNAAYLEIFVEPGDAGISVEGKVVQASGGIAKLEVKPGRKVIIASKDGYDSEQTMVDIYPGETKRVNLKLSQASSSKTWLYLLGGAAIAGGAAYFVLAKKPPSPDGGTTTGAYGNPPGFPPVP
ncbi:MAG: PEGA domain-containing protein [Bacteroidota bacterium]